MKQFPKILAVVVVLSAVISVSAFAGNSYGFSFSYGNPGYGYNCAPRYGGNFSYGYSYCAPPVYYAPPVQYYCQPPVTYYRYYYAPPTYYYGGGYCR